MGGKKVGLALRARRIPHGDPVERYGRYEAQKFVGHVPDVAGSKTFCKLKPQIDIKINTIILMTMNSAQAVYKEALGLSDLDRAALAHDLISSLSGDALKSIAQEEIEKRVSLIHSGNAIFRPASSVFRDIRNKL